MADADLRSRAALALFDAIDGAVEYGVVVADADGTMRLVTGGAERLIGRGVTESGPETWPEEFGTFREDMVTPFPADELPLVQAFRGTSTDGVVMFLRNPRIPQGVWLSITGRPMLDARGAVTGGLVVFHDISEIKRLEERQRQSTKLEAIGRLAGGVAHDFNNLLCAITGYSDLLLDRFGRAGGDPDERAWVQEIAAAGRRAAGLTRQLLAFSRKQVLAPRVIDLGAVLPPLSTLLERLITERVDLVTVLQPGTGQIRIDPTQLEQVVINLAVNARDAMPGGGKLTIETRNVELDSAYARVNPDVKPGPYVLLAVSDTGVGMDQATQSRLFEPFFTTKQAGSGTGLGLATVYGIVKQSNGHITVYSEPGRGTSFKLYFPRVDARPDPEAPSSGAIALNPTGTETVLLVEDDAAVRQLVASVLRTSGYTVLEADCARQALAASAAHDATIHLLLTDIVIPGLGGKDLHAKLVEERPRLRVLFMSGYADEAVVQQGELDPGMAFLNKPFTPARLAREVRAVLEG